MSDNLLFNGMTAEGILEKLTEKGITKADAGYIVGNWILEKYGKKTKRVFSYSETFAETVPSCGPTFNRSFEHLDWIDGESVVQAEKTAGEEGFNERFHKIEKDLDALGKDVSKAFLCMAEMRKSLKKMMDEVKTELNRINTDIYDCCSQDTGVQVGPWNPPYYGAIDQGIFLGSTNFGGKDVSIWQTEKGMLLLPSIKTIGVNPWDEIRILKAGSLFRFVEENPEVRKVFSPEVAVTKEAFINKFGFQTTKDRQQVSDLLAILPDGVKYRSMDAMIEAVAEGEAAALRTTEGAKAAVAAVYGLSSDADTVAKASIEKAEGIPSAIRSALVGQKITTMGQLAQATPSAIQGLLKKAGVTITSGEAGQYIGMAKTFSKMM